MLKHNFCFLLLILIMSSLFGGCTSLSLQKRLKKDSPIRLGVVGFKITAPLKEMEDISSLDGKDEKAKFDFKAELIVREQDAKKYFLDYMGRYKNIHAIDIPSSEADWSKGFKLSKADIKRIKSKYNLDAIIIGEVPWYGKTNIMFPIIGFTADVLSESIIIGLVTKWNWTIILANVGLEVVTNAPIWFGGSWLFGRAYKPVTLDTRLYVFKEKMEVIEESFEAARSKHMLEKYSKKERKKTEFKLEASFRKVLKEVAVELSEE